MTTMPDHPESEDDTTDLSPLLSEPFARAWAAPATGLPGRLGERLGERLQRSLQAEAGMVTVRLRHSRAEDGLRWLYRAPADRPLRPGEPRAACFVDVPAQGFMQFEPSAGPREFLVLDGEVEIDTEALVARDYLLLPGGNAARLVSLGGARVFMREGDATVAAQRTLVRDRDAGWPEFAPGIRRRVLWSAGGQAALLYHADAGASVPVHRHGHDEECLMVQGELFLDDVLLQQGDYQLAPAGTGHCITETDTGVVIYAHGDADLQFT
ncbi:cupin domain-containing protein [Roseateles cellulosilyticus]|uniref:Cupin domain-containing protein n=1 Tax=Pelomonas cellulosilytica TaxID=2906762 RepID=A0ABS8XRF0_9BURK|nr:cupin domain-containing protein [Pelomonas sp. P8]MCE4553426.1 cupin domain-containing protein [Pelomonas sp. P8]